MCPAIVSKRVRVSANRRQMSLPRHWRPYSDWPWAGCTRLHHNRRRELAARDRWMEIPNRQQTFNCLQRTVNKSQCVLQATTGAPQNIKKTEALHAMSYDSTLLPSRGLTFNLCVCRVSIIYICIYIYVCVCVCEWLLIAFASPTVFTDGPCRLKQIWGGLVWMGA